MATSSRERGHSEPEEERSAKRAKVESDGKDDQLSDELQPALQRHLPPSHALLGVPPQESFTEAFPSLSEGDVGISEYVDRNVPKIEGIIKQR
jgi:tRNA pseudouridine13 synthase